MSRRPVNTGLRPTIRRSVTQWGPCIDKSMSSLVRPGSTLMAHAGAACRRRFQRAFRPVDRPCACPTVEDPVGQESLRTRQVVGAFTGSAVQTKLHGVGVDVAGGPHSYDGRQSRRPPCSAGRWTGIRCRQSSKTAGMSAGSARSRLNTELNRSSASPQRRRRRDRAPRPPGRRDQAFGRRWPSSSAGRHVVPHELVESPLGAGPCTVLAYMTDEPSPGCSSACPEHVHGRRLVDAR